MKEKILIILFLSFVLSAAIKIEAQTREAYVGQYVTFVAPSPPQGALYATAWGSNNSHVSVQKDTEYSAKVTILSYFEGQAQIQCDYYWYWYAYGRQYTNNATTYFYVSCKPVNLRIQPTSMNLKLDEFGRITYTYSPSSISPKPIISFYSKNTAVAKVDNDGYVRGCGGGSTTIIVENNAGPNAECNVTVSADPTSIKLEDLSILEGESNNIKYTVEPNGANYTLTWSSSNENIVTVSSSGRVTGNKAGEAKITAKINGYDISGSCKVTVKAKPTRIQIPKKMTVVQSFSKTIVAETTPVDAVATVTWRSKDTSIATVTKSSAFSAQVTGKKAGSTVIYVSTSNNLTDSCMVTVNPLPQNVSQNEINQNILYINNLKNRSLKKLPK